MPTSADLLAGLPAPLPLTPEDIREARTTSTAQIVVLDDHPTGSQSMADVPVLTAWSPDQIQWALETDAPAVFIVTGSRALSAAAAEDRYIQVTQAVLQVAEEMGRRVAFALRTDSSLRGHYPLDTDILVNAIESAAEERIDGVVMVPAFAEAGRVTVNGMHYVSEWAGDWTPIGESRFAKDPAFPFTSSDLRAWVAEKTRGRYQGRDIIHIGLDDVRTSPDVVASHLMRAKGAQPIVVDAVTEEDLRSIALGVIAAVTAGKRFVYRVSPPFIRAIVGQPVLTPLSVADIAAMKRENGVDSTSHGLIIAGTPVPFTRRQLRVLEQRRPIRDIPVSVPAVFDVRRDALIDDVVSRAVEGLETSNVVIRLVDVHADLEITGDFSIDPRIAKAVNEIVYRIVKRVEPGFVVARGGSIVAPVAQGLGVRRALIRGPLLDGIVSLWEPLAGRIAGVPLAVYAGGVGDDDGLADIVDKLSGIEPPLTGRHLTPTTPSVAPVQGNQIAVIGLGSKGRAVAGRLSETYTVRAWDIDPSANDVARADGVEVAGSAAEAIAGASIVMIAVRDFDDLEEVLYGTAGVASEIEEGAVVCILGAVGVTGAREIATRLGEENIHVVDAPLSGGGARARRGEIACLVGGVPSVIARVQPVLEKMAATVLVAGDAVGDGQAMKAVNQLLAAVNLVGVAEALSLADSLGLDPEKALSALTTGAAHSFMASDRGGRMLEVLNGMSPQLINRFDLTSSDLTVALEIARENGVATPVASSAEQVFLRAARRVDPDADDAEIVRIVEND